MEPLCNRRTAVQSIPYSYHHHRRIETATAVAWAVLRRAPWRRRLRASYWPGAAVAERASERVNGEDHAELQKERSIRSFKFDSIYFEVGLDDRSPLAHARGPRAAPGSALTQARRRACMQTVFTRIAACAAGAGPGSLGSESVSPLAVSLKEDGLL